MQCAHSVSREMSRGDGEKEARRNIYGIRSVGRIIIVTDNAVLWGTTWGSPQLFLTSAPVQEFCQITRHKMMSL